MKRFPDDLTGLTFGRLTVIERAPSKSKLTSIWFCACSCGKKTRVYRTGLIRGSTRSCGCLKRELMTTHGFSNHPNYNIWFALRNRKGVCDRWLKSFEDFLTDAGERPSKEHFLSKPNPDLELCSSNFCWMTIEERREHRSNMKKSRDEAKEEEAMGEKDPVLRRKQYVMVWLTVEERKRVEEAAPALGRSRSNLIRQALREYLNKHYPPAA